MRLFAPPARKVKPHGRRPCDEPVLRGVCPWDDLPDCGAWHIPEHRSTRIAARTGHVRLPFVLMEASVAESTENKALAAYAARDDLAEYGSNGLMLFALQLRHGVEDIETVAATSLTDGSNDKKCDLVYVDRGDSRIVVAQGHSSSDTSKQEAPSNKSSDLNTAVGWLIAGDLDVVPENLRSAAQEVRDALQNDEIRTFEIW